MPYLGTGRVEIKVAIFGQWVKINCLLLSMGVVPGSRHGSRLGNRERLGAVTHATESLQSLDNWVGIEMNCRGSWRDFDQ